MIEIHFTVLNFLGVLVAAHVVNVFLSWVLHYVQHQRVLGFDLYRIHLEGHHALDRYVSAPELRRFWDTMSHALWAVLILSGWVVYYVVFTKWIAFTFMAESVALSVGLYYLHREYDDPDSWMGRYAWFRRARALHEIHHGHKGDFTRSVNYAIGGPLLGALPDRVLATFEDVRGAVRAASGIEPLDFPATVVGGCGQGTTARPVDDGSSGSPNFGDAAGSVS